MKYLNLALSATFVLCSTYAQAADIFEPIAGNGNQQVSQTGLSESQARLSVAMTYMGKKYQETTVFHPNGSGKLSHTFSPYDYRNIVNTNVFLLSIKNTGSQPIGASDLRLQVSLNGLPYEYLDTKELSEKWRKYYYLNTNTVTGAPNFMEQERAIAAEKFIQKNGFQAKDVPPGGEIKGLVAVPFVKENGSLKFRVQNIGDKRGFQDFVFRFNAKNKP